ncbi:MAG: LPS export ABC transporter periplasmic protein LptC [Vicinamibacterales bacterium]
MAPWQRRARLLIAVLGIAFAIVVARAFRPRVAPPPPTIVERSDPQAAVESTGGVTLRFNRDKEEIRVSHQTSVTTTEGTTRLGGVTVNSDRGGRSYALTADTAQISDKESEIVLEGHVRMTANDGLVIGGDRATYVENEGIVRVPGPVTFSRGRMSGTALGMNYDQRHDVLQLLDQVSVTVRPGDGDGAMQLTAGGAELRRPDHIMRFDRSLQTIRHGRIMSAATGVAHLAADDETLQLLELRGGSRVQDAPALPGGLELMTATDMDLRYGSDGVSLEQALLVGAAVIDIAGQQGSGSRRISANTIDIALTAKGAPRTLVGRDRVQLVMPAGGNGATRTVTAQLLEAAGEGDTGLRTAHFSGNVQYRERGQTVNRAARSGVLDLVMAPGLGAIQEARFSRAVRFEEGKMGADAAVARYVLDKGLLELSGREPGREKPHLTHERFGVYATTISILLDGPDVTAVTDVKSVLHPSTSRDDSEGATLPSLLKRDQVVNVSAAELRYDAKASRATYTGNALLWQGETSIKADTIVLDDKKGDLQGDGKVATSLILEQTDKGKTERVRSTTTSKTFQYVEALRKATYTGDAHMNSPQGDMTAARIELFLKSSGEQLDRAEAYEAVTLREKARKTTGGRLTYYSTDERYVMTGAPVTVVDECARETTGRTLTFFRTTDRIVVDGSEQVRTQTKGGSQCSGS